MNPTIQSVLDHGSNGAIIDIECHISSGLPNMIIVGLGNKAIDEAKERVRSAFTSSKHSIPPKRIVINLAPADIPKESTGLDLGIGLAILYASGQLTRPLPERCAVIGELGLDGTIRAVRGIIGKIIIAKRHGIHTFILPRANLEQAALVPNVRLFAFENLGELSGRIMQPVAKWTPESSSVRSADEAPIMYGPSFGDISGQDRAKRAMEIVAAGGHNIFLSGPPGTGKSMLAKALPSILPQLSRSEMLEVTHLHSLANNEFEKLVTARPFRSPHHSSSSVSIIGGGHKLRPGEISLSHQGVLFLDEMPEFPRSIIEALRQPLEDNSITVARARDSATFLANFILVATANPCPCGYFGTSKPCRCPAHLVAKYQQKISGPILDRIDLYVEVEEVLHERLLALAPAGNDQEIRVRVAKARDIQHNRFNGHKLNSNMDNRDIKAHANLRADSLQLLNHASKKLRISARSYMHIVKVGRTIADLDQSPDIAATHISEALQYRAPSPSINIVS